MTSKWLGAGWRQGPGSAQLATTHSGRTCLPPHAPPCPTLVPPQVKYNMVDDTTVEKAFEMQPRPHAPWSYPQTGQGVLLPLVPPYDQ